MLSLLLSLSYVSVWLHSVTCLSLRATPVTPSHSLPPGYHLSPTHPHRWEDFTDAVVRVLNKKGNLVYLLWGNPAQNKYLLPSIIIVTLNDMTCDVMLQV